LSEAQDGADQRLRTRHQRLDFHELLGRVAASADRVVRVSVSSAERVAERTFSGDDGA